MAFNYYVDDTFQFAHTVFYQVTDDATGWLDFQHVEWDNGTFTWYDIDLYGEHPWLSVYTELNEYFGHYLQQTVWDNGAVTYYPWV